MIDMANFGLYILLRIELGQEKYSDLKFQISDLSTFATCYLLPATCYLLPAILALVLLKNSADIPR